MLSDLVPVRKQLDPIVNDVAHEGGRLHVVLVADRLNGGLLGRSELHVDVSARMALLFRSLIVDVDIVNRRLTEKGLWFHEASLGHQVRGYWKRSTPMTSFRQSRMFLLPYVPWIVLYTDARVVLQARATRKMVHPFMDSRRVTDSTGGKESASDTARKSAPRSVSVFIVELDFFKVVSYKEVGCGGVAPRDRVPAETWTIRREFVGSPGPMSRPGKVSSERYSTITYSMPSCWEIPAPRKRFMSNCGGREDVASPIIVVARVSARVGVERLTKSRRRYSEALPVPT